MQLLLDHPGVRDAALVRLATADARAFYDRFGFLPEEEAQFGFPLSRLLLRRPVVQPA
jgi:hypothetical protein